MATVALRAAIQEVQKAVERVEGKVDDLVALTKADTIADVLANHRVLADYVTAWIGPARFRASTGTRSPGLARTREGDRKAPSLCALAASTTSPTHRAPRTRQGLHEMADDSRLGEVLQLLVVAEDSHYLWQRLRIERSRTSDPDQVAEIVESARRQLREDLKADVEFVRGLQEWLVEYGKLKPLEIHRILSRNKLEADVPSSQAGTR